MKAVTTINSIETSALCDNQCPYCPAWRQPRETGLMSMDTFRAALSLVKYFARRGTQQELNLFGIGEPLLNPDIVKMVEEARRAMPISKPVHLNTNGNNLTIELARGLKAAGISSVHVTGHDPRTAAAAIRMLQILEIPCALSVDFMAYPNDWAKQIEWFPPLYSTPCPWLNLGQCMVAWDGQVTTCCLDASGFGVIGTVNDDPASLMVRPFALCHNCHHIVPPLMDGYIYSARKNEKEGLIHAL